MKTQKLIHGFMPSKHPLYARWSGIINRTQNKDNPNYHNYGGRGIEVCTEWEVFEVFAKDLINKFPYMLESQYQHLQIDREDNEGNYEIDNIRITTAIVNCNNKSNSNYYIVSGKVFDSLSEAVIFLGITEGEGSLRFLGNRSKGILPYIGYYTVGKYDANVESRIEVYKNFSKTSFHPQVNKHRKAIVDDFGYLPEF